MAIQRPHADVTPQQAVEHLRADPGLPIANPLPSLWQQPPNEPIASHQSTELPKETDVVIIGSGITGTSVARHLLQQDDKVKITMLEARTITSGATGRNGGFIMTVPELFYVGMAKPHGKQVAKELVKFTLDNQDALLGLIDTLPPAITKTSELRRLEQLHVFSSEQARSNAQAWVQILSEEFDEVPRRTKMISKEELLTKYQIESPFGGAVMPSGAAWPYRLITGILTDLWQTYGNRFSIEAETPAQSVQWSAASGRYSIQTPRGSITAQNVIHATNAHAGHLLPTIRGFLHPLRCQVTVQDKAPEFQNQGANNTWVITSPGGLHSIYQSPQTGDIYASGQVGTSNFFEEFTPREDKNDDAVISRLSTALNTIYGAPVQGAVKANWTGIMGYTTDGSPLVGRVGEDISGRAGTGEYIAAGFNGFGMIMAWLSGQHIADSVLGVSRPRPIPSIFAVSKDRLGRVPLESVLARTYGTWE